MKENNKILLTMNFFPSLTQLSLYEVKKNKYLWNHLFSCYIL
jgi:hypothetical protein